MAEDLERTEGRKGVGVGVVCLFGVGAHEERYFVKIKLKRARVPVTVQSSSTALLHKSNFGKI